jgi:hypothetical protein
MKRNSGRWTNVVSIIGESAKISAKILCLGSVLLTAACSTPTLSPSDFPAFHLTSSPDKDKSEEPGTN